jgi:cell division protein FtsA
MAGKGKSVIVGLDIGTTKTCAVVGEWTDQGVSIIGIGSHPSEGLRRGVVVNIESTVEGIRRAVEEAERISGCEIRSVYAGVAGAHIQGQNSLGIVAVKGREVDPDDVKRAIEAAQAVAIPLDRQIIHTLPQSYTVDTQEGVRMPVGMSGVRLEAKVHIVTGSVASIQNVMKSVNRVGLDIQGIVLEQLASCLAVLGEDEKDLGVALLDIGGGTTDIAVFTEGSIRHTAVLPVGGSYITSDIATGLRTPAAEAEKIKLKYGCAFPPMISKDETIEVPSVGGREPREVSRQILGRIIEARVDEILLLAQKEIARSGYDDRLAAGIVLTGGTALLEGITELAERVFNVPVRRGCPQGVVGLSDIVNSPLYATGVGLVTYGSVLEAERRRPFRGKGQVIDRAVDRMRRWILEFF